MKPPHPARPGVDAGDEGRVVEAVTGVPERPAQQLGDLLLGLVAGSLHNTHG